MPSYSVIAPDGRAYGPADESTLAQWAREGRLAPDTMLQCHETGAHSPARAVPALQPFLGLSPQMVQTLVQQPLPMNPAMAAPQAGMMPIAQPIGYSPSSEHGLTSFNTPLTIVLHFITFGIFSWIHFGLMHDRLPKNRHDDPSSVKAILFYLIPFFNIYWMFFEKLRLIDRINEQRRLAGLPDGPNKGLYITAVVLMIIPFVGWISMLVLYPVFIGTLRSGVNGLVQVTRPGM